MTRARATPLVLWLVLIILGAWWLGFKTSVATDLTAFLPTAHTKSERLLLDELRAGPASRIVLIGLEGGTAPQLAQSSRALAQRLRESPMFSHVANGEQLLDDHAQALLFEYRYLLSPTVSPERFSAAQLHQALQQRLRELASPLGGVEKQYVAADPTAEFRALLESWRDPNAPALRHGVWFDRDGSRALLLVQTRASAYEMEAQADALAAIRAVAAQVRADDSIRLVLAGPGLYAVASRDATRQETHRLSIAASLAVAAILWFAYRSIPVLLLGALPLLTGMLAAAAAVSVVFGGIHGLTLAFGATLLGIAIDYPIHVFSHMRGGQAMDCALARIWPTMALGVITTALGFGALIGAGFVGLAQLGVFSVTGLLVSAAVTRWGLPALVPGRWRLPAPRRQRLVPWLLQAQGRLGPVSALLIAAVLAVLLAGGPFPWEDDLGAMSPLPDRVRALDEQLRSALGAPEVSHAVVISAAAPEAALARTERVAADLQQLTERGVLSGYTAVTRFLPSAATQMARRQQLPDAAQLQRAMRQATRSLPFRDGAFVPFLDDVAAARLQPPLTLDALRNTTLAARISALLFPGDSGWTSVMALSGVRDSKALSRWAQQAGAHVHYLNQRATVRDLMTRFRLEGLGRAAWSAAIILAVLALALRSGARLARVLLPLALATILDIAVLTALGERISLFHLVALLMVLGAGVDYSLFFNRPDPDPADRRRTLHALLVCATSTVAVFGILAWSDIPVLRAIGSTVAIGVSASLVFALLLARPGAAR